MEKQINIKKLVEFHVVNFNGQKIVGTFEDLEELCLALEEYCYDEPTYEELQESSSSLKRENEKLKDQIEQYKHEALYPEAPFDVERRPL